MNRGQIRSIIRDNLGDAGVSQNFQDEDINNSISDAYNDIASKSRCIIKSVTLNWLSGVNYYDFRLGNNGANNTVSDYLGTIAIFNNVTNQWLRDDINLRDFDRLRNDWELWTGQPQFWTPHSLKYSAITPRLTQASGTFILWYWANSPGFGAPNDSQFDLIEPLISPDMQGVLFESFCTADLFESIENVGQASRWWPQYFLKIKEYKARCKKNCAYDILQRI